MSWAFLALGLVCLTSAVMVVASRTVIHSAVYLVLSVLATAGIFLVLGAEFLAAVQVLVYAGSVIVLFVFVIMTVGYGETRHPPLTSGRTVLAAVTGVLALAEILVSLRSLPPGGVSAAPAPAVVWETLGRILFVDWLLALEVLSLLILAVMVGISALRPEEGGEG